MNETVLIWIFGAIFTLIAGLFIFCFQINNRLVRIETMLEVYGKKVARQLHSPTNHHGLDGYLDKYIDNNYDMSQKEWEELQKKCDELIRNAHASDMEKGQAAFISALCTHKLMAYGIKPKMQEYSNLTEH